MNSPLSTLFRGQAHFKVLELLSTRIQPVRLRTLADLSQMYVRSIQLALSFFVKERVVTRARISGRIVYSLNEAHPQYLVLRGLFSFIADASARDLNLDLDKKAQEALLFSESAMKLFRSVKR